MEHAIPGGYGLPKEMHNGTVQEFGHLQELGSRTTQSLDELPSNAVFVYATSDSLHNTLLISLCSSSNGYNTEIPRRPSLAEPYSLGVMSGLQDSMHMEISFYCEIQE